MDAPCCLLPAWWRWCQSDAVHREAPETANDYLFSAHDVHGSWMVVPFRECGMSRKHRMLYGFARCICWLRPVVLPLFPVGFAGGEHTTNATDHQPHDSQSPDDLPPD